MALCLFLMMLQAYMSEQFLSTRDLLFFLHVHSSAFFHYHLLFFDRCVQSTKFLSRSAIDTILFGLLLIQISEQDEFRHHLSTSLEHALNCEERYNAQEDTPF